MYFHVYKKNYPVSSGQHIFIILVPFKSKINKALYEGHLTKFRHCIFQIQQFEFSGIFEKSHFPNDVNGDVAQTLSTTFLKICSLEMNEPCLLLYLFNFQMTPKLLRCQEKQDKFYIANMKIHVSLWSFPNVTNTFVHLL